MELVELEQIIRACLSAGMESVALYLTIVSGFLIVAYSAGSEIPKFLSAMITTLFFVFSMIVIFGGYETFFAAHNYSRIFGPELQYPTISIWYARAVVAAEIVGIIGCLVYMYQVRKK